MSELVEKIIKIKEEIGETSKRIIKNVHDSEAFNSERYCQDILENYKKS